MATASSATREVERLKIKLDLSKDYASIKKVAKATGKHEKDYSWRLLKGVSEALGLERKNVDDENYGEVKAYHKQAWREAYGVDITRILRSNDDRSRNSTTFYPIDLCFWLADWSSSR